ncbi:MAG: polysaccharide biosynthesis C-terminal domain-containing protein, partial [Marinoscillum sp.]
TLILLFGLGLISFDWMVKALSIIYGMSVLLLLGFLILKYDFKFVLKFKNLGREIKREMFKFGGNLLLVAFGGTVATQIFFLLVSVYIGLDANGIFTTCFYVATVIEMPKRSMLQVIVPIFAKEFKADNIVEINKLYKRSSITLSVASILILLGVITNLDDLFHIIPKGEIFREGIMVVILISTSKVIDLMFGFNSEIINYSKHYRSLLVFTTVYAVITLISCFLLIPAFGIDGAAWSFLISIVIYNITKYLFLRIKLNLSPFGKEHLILIILGILIYLAFYYIPFGLEPLFNIISKSILITLIYSLIVYFLKISPDINKLVNQIINKLFKINA